VKLIVLLGVAACGRVGFDPITNGNPLGGGDAASSTGGDAHPIDAGPAGGSAMPDAQRFACANALNLQLAARLTTSTCVGGDHVDGCGPPSTQEVVFEFVAPASDGYQFQAYDTGTTNISNSTTTLDATCTVADQPSCSGVLGLTLNQGDVLYLVVEAASGGCTTIDFLATAN
jgi:hypothetical protein